MPHIFEYDVNTDSRFLKTLDTQYVDLLDKHGFPIDPNQPKNVHDLGEALGSEYNYYIDQAKQLFISSKLAIAVGEDLDIFGVQFGVPRNTGEDDEAYRFRLQAVFSPRKVTRPHVEGVLNQFSDVSPSLFEPWRDVIVFDVDFPYDYRYDTGPWRMWSPDYWRSGILVIKSGLTDKIFGVVDSLINAGVVIWYEQQHTSASPEHEFIPGMINYQEDVVVNKTHLFERFFFDIDHPGHMDDPLSRLDVGDFTISPSGQDDIIVSRTFFSFSNCFEIPVLPNGIFDEGVWDEAQWQDPTNGITFAHLDVLNNPWMVFDTIDPGAFIANENAFHFDLAASASFDTDPNQSGFDNNSVIVNNDQNILDSVTFVITGWIPTDTCKEGDIVLNDVIVAQHNIPLYVEEFPGEYLIIEVWELLFDTVDFEDVTVTIAEYVTTCPSSFGFTDRVDLEDEVYRQSTLTLVDTNTTESVYIITASDSFGFTDSNDAQVEIGEVVTLGDNNLLGDGARLTDLPDITLDNIDNTTLDNFDIE